MTELVEAYERLENLQRDWRAAVAEMRDDRNQIAGQIYEHRKLVESLLADYARDQYASGWIDRWHA